MEPCTVCGAQMRYVTDTYALCYPNAHPRRDGPRLEVVVDTKKGAVLPSQPRRHRKRLGRPPSARAKAVHSMAMMGIARKHKNPAGLR